MLTEIEGLHHVTSIASSSLQNNAFFTNVLGLRRIKATVNFDFPEVYHLYYGDEIGSAGSVMTYFPFENRKRRTKGAGEVGVTVFSVPKDALGFWTDRLANFAVSAPKMSTSFGQARLEFTGPDGDEFALVECEDNRIPWTTTTIPKDVAIRGFHSAEMRLNEVAATAELLNFMGYEKFDTQDEIQRFILPNGGPANIIDLRTNPTADAAVQGAGSVHHIAFSVKDRAAQAEVRRALLDTGYAVTGVRDRNYFYAIYFKSPQGILFEVATHEPGFDFDEDRAHLGSALKLPPQHEHLRKDLATKLTPLDGVSF